MQRLPLPKSSRRAAPDAEMIAIRALGFIAADEDLLGGFLAATGLSPGDLRGASREPGFHAAVLTYLGENEATLLAFAGENGFAPEAVAAAREKLSGTGGWDGT